MKVLLLLPLTLTLLITCGTSALAQVDGSYPPPPGSYSKGSYTVLEDGTLIYDGDIAMTCEDLPRLVGDPDLPSARGAFEACTKFGFPPPGPDGVRLPETGGGALPLPILGAKLLAVGLVLRALG